MQDIIEANGVGQVLLMLEGGREGGSIKESFKSCNYEVEFDLH